MRGALDALGHWCTVYGYLVDWGCLAALAAVFAALVLAHILDPEDR